LRGPLDDDAPVDAAPLDMLPTDPATDDVVLLLSPPPSECAGVDPLHPTTRAVTQAIPQS
jgi:hypothetical protein